MEKQEKHEKHEKKVQYLAISDGEAGQRLDNYLISRLKGAPKSLIYRVIRKGEVRVNKGRAKPDKKLQVGDVVRVPPLRLSEKKTLPPVGSGLRSLLQSAIVYDSDALLIINKPSGLAVHGGSGVNLGLIESLRQIYSESRFLELVHRLDRETSGCVMVAKKRSMLRHLQALLRESHQVDKRYTALVRGRWSNRKRVVDAPLKKNELLSGERIVKVSPDGKASKTEFDVIQRYETATLVCAKPITGRTHQIRVHARHANHPLIGDPKYGDDDFNKVMRGKGFKRLFLHASSLAFVLPDGEQVKVEAPLPEDLKQPLSILKELEE